MARGKIEIKRIENQTNRQVTFSKRRNGLFKKAHELSILCDAKVSVLVLSSNKKPYEYHTPSSSTKEIVDLYQRAKDVDVWSSVYQKMEEDLRKLKDVNAGLRLEIRRRLGQDLENMDIGELTQLAGAIEEDIKVIRERKSKVISSKTETKNRQYKSQKTLYRNLNGFEIDEEALKYGIVKSLIPEEYKPVIDYFDGGGGARLLNIRHLQPTDPSNLTAPSDITTFPIP